LIGESGSGKTLTYETWSRFASGLTPDKFFFGPKPDQTTKKSLFSSAAPHRFCFSGRRAYSIAVFFDNVAYRLHEKARMKAKSSSE